MPEPGTQTSFSKPWTFSTGSCQDTCQCSVKRNIPSPRPLILPNDFSYCARLAIACSLPFKEILAREDRDEALLASDSATPRTWVPSGLRPPAAVPLPQEAPSWSRKETASKEEALADTSARGRQHEPPRKLYGGIVLPTMKEKSGRAEVGRGGDRAESDGAVSDQSKGHQSSFFFNLGRSMMLEDFEWDGAISRGAVASLTGGAHDR